MEGINKDTINIKSYIPKESGEIFFDAQTEMRRIGNDPLSSFSEEKEEGDKLKKEKHKNFLSKLNHPELFLGVGNNGIVCSFNPENKDDTEQSCLKFAWDNIDVIPGYKIPNNPMTEDLFIELYPEIQRLYKISEGFKIIRETNKRLIEERNMNNIEPPHSPAKEAAIQEVCHKLFTEDGIDCTIPEIQAVIEGSEHTPEDEEDSYPEYILNLKYGAIVMEKIKGFSISDLILNYPNTKNLIEEINFEDFKNKLESAVSHLNKKNICHNDITIRNIMFDSKRKRPAIIDFGKTIISQEIDPIKKIDTALKWLKDFLENPEKTKLELEKKQKDWDSKHGLSFDK